MKNPLLALALLLAPALASAVPIPVPRLGDSVFVNDSRGAGTGTLMPNGDVMGPLCPPDICGGASDAGAFNALSQIPPEGQEWADPSCNRIPCRLKETEEAPADGETTGAPIVVTGKRGPKPSGEKALPGGAVVTATADGVSIKTPDGKTLSPEQTQALLVAAAAQNKGFDPLGYDPTGLGGRTPPPASPTVPLGQQAGMAIGDGLMDLGGFDDISGAESGPGTSSTAGGGRVVKGAYGDVRLTEYDPTAQTAGLRLLNEQAGEQIRRLEKIAGAGENALGPSNASGAGSVERAGCDARNPEMRGLCAR